MAVGAVEVVKARVIDEFAVVEELNPPFPGGVSLGMSGGGDSIDSRLCRTQKSSMEVISGGSRLMQKPGGICKWHCLETAQVRDESDAENSQDRRSAISFLVPANHWLHWQMAWEAIAPMQKQARAEWEACSSLSVKLDFCSHPKEEVLSLMFSSAEPGGISEPHSKRSRREPAMQARNSR